MRSHSFLHSLSLLYCFACINATADGIVWSAFCLREYHAQITCISNNAKYLEKKTTKIWLNYSKYPKYLNTIYNISFRSMKFPQHFVTVMCFNSYGTYRHDNISIFFSSFFTVSFRKYILLYSKMKYTPSKSKMKKKEEENKETLIVNLRQQQRERIKTNTVSVYCIYCFQ